MGIGSSLWADSFQNHSLKTGSAVELVEAPEPAENWKKLFR